MQSAAETFDVRQRALVTAIDEGDAMRVVAGKRTECRVDVGRLMRSGACAARA